MRHYRQEPIKVSCHLAKFGGYRHCGSGDKMMLVCHVTLQDQVITGSRDFMGRSSSRYVIILSSLVAIETLIVEI